MGSRMWKCLKDKNHQSWQNLSGYNIKYLCNHLEKQFDDNMNWDNYGSYWHIDHIIPLSFFEYEDFNDVEFKLAWHINNLQPLEACANISKRNKLMQPLIEQIDFRI